MILLQSYVAGSNPGATPIIKFFLYPSKLWPLAALRRQTLTQLE